MNKANAKIIGPYTGQLAEQFAFPEFVAALHHLPRLLAAPESRVLNQVRNRIVCVALPRPDGGTITVAVKCFRRPSAVRSRIYRWQGSKARRSWRNARFLVQHRVGTPLPVGFLERWENDRLVESYFLTEFQPDAVEVRHEVIRLFRGEPQYEAGRRLLLFIARQVRALHNTGLQHNDLGYQNILVRRTAAGWEDAQFIDLNRARIRSALSARQRALELARLWLPHSLQPLFFDEYFSGGTVPPGFHLWKSWYRTTAALRRASRDLRHPRQAQRRKELGFVSHVYPPAEAL